jgi:hypothetical protein
VEAKRWQQVEEIETWKKEMWRKRKKRIWTKRISRTTRKWRRPALDVAWKGVNGKGTMAKVCIRMARPIAVRVVPMASIAPVQHKHKEIKLTFVASWEGPAIIIMGSYEDSRLGELKIISTISHGQWARLAA